MHVIHLAKVLWDSEETSPLDRAGDYELSFSEVDPTD
jgi:hypothetical protein